MDSARDRFFGVGELMLMLGEFMPKSSVSRLMQTNKHFYDLFTPVLFHTLDKDYLTSLSNTPDSLMVLGKNVRHVRSLTISRNFCMLYFAGLMAFQDLLDAALVPVSDDDDVRLLAKTVATLTRLETLFLTVSPSPQQRITNITPRIFFSCSSSLNSFTVNILLPAMRRVLVVPLAHSNSSVEPLTPRRDPLPRLTAWQGSKADFVNADSICSILEHCGSVTRLEVPFVQEPQEYSRIAKCIVDNCPDLKHLGDTRGYCGQSGEFVGKVLAAVAENSLESGFQNERPRLGQAIQRHSGSLTIIKFYNCQSISSATILSILVSCVALKNFIVIGSMGRDGDISLHLADAVSQSWVSTGLQNLQLEITIGDLNAIRNPLYSRPAPVVLTDEETEWMSQLGMLYHQIGMLKELEGLELKVAIENFLKIVSADLDDDDEDVVEYEVCADDEPDDDYNSNTDFFRYQDVSFPGWLSLGNVGKGWPGYLETLTGLTKL
ncbi:hypothetical protein EC957_004486 [Mortierella hygrophila]|uniref:Uncharacterized protein n=1 Tax=Mortierella hygrophila TaxID=979708 RepID=A0A9P6FFD3_9FUNG|nr:hypothetical protein EC957_004486 [Mortierella hygrophila]